MLLLKAFVVSLNSSVRREGTTQTFRHGGRKGGALGDRGEDLKDEHTGWVLLIK